MNIGFNSFLVVFIIISILIVIVYPIADYNQQKKLKKSIMEGNNLKLKWYYNTIIWSWIPIVIIFLLIPLYDLKISSIGIKWIDFGVNKLNNWIIYIATGLCIIYFLYNVYSIFILKYSKRARLESAEKIPQDFKNFLPITPKEKRTWDLVAVSAGITEEIIYRGYLFYAFDILFPNLSIYIILMITTLLFGIGHIYQGIEAIRPTIIGLIYGFLYIVFDSIVPIIFLHIAQDLIVRDLLEENIHEIDTATNSVS